MSRVVVLGGGLSGLLAATALSRYAAEVTVVESDTLPDSPQPRKGLPQSRHSHMLMAGGARAMDALLPGTTDALYAAGAHRRGMPWGIVTYSAEGWYRRHRDSDAHLISCSRDLLDHVVRQQVFAAAAGIKVLQKTQVVGLAGTSARISGVRVEQDGEERTLPANLVIDATGRLSKAPQWLASLGLPTVREEIVDPGLAYATRLYQAPGGVHEQFPAVMVQPKAGTGEPGHGASVFPIEDGRWIVALYGTRGAQPPTSDEDFLAFARTTRNPIVAEIIASAEPIGEIRGYRATANRRRRYDKLPVPEGFLAVGDAVTALNPIYGHGMSVAAHCAFHLDRRLRKRGLAAASTRRLQAGIVRVGTPAWTMATTTDRWFPDVKANHGRAGGPMAQRFSARIARTATCDAALSRTLFDVTTLSASPAQLSKPSVLLSALRGSKLPPLTTEQALAQYPELGDVRKPISTVS
ncbi:NAD(P)/FAD-dependent oxidoreductase [Kitasatospora sp. NPDC086801]|uniref:NAD(P)/FAD-dependent oxidoreductase n=1 Tax=Kitasatospora sp. NPDC086801 TaxID=3364066 RepID=UPI00380F761F